VLLLLVVTGTSLGGWYFLARRHGARPDLILHAIKREKLMVTVVDRGSLESADNNEIICKVKAKSPNTPASTIRWIIDNGRTVKKGDPLVELDDSTLQDQLVTQQVDLAKAKGEWEVAEQVYKIQMSNAEGGIKTAEVGLAVKKIQLQEYLEGLYQKDKVNLENQLTMANSDLVMWEERAAWSERMSRPGRQYVTTAQADADRARRLSAELTLENFKTQYKVLNELTKAKNVTDFQGQVEEARRLLDRSIMQAEATRLQYDADREAKFLIYEKNLAKVRDTERELEHCSIKAPKAGMVVYYIEPRARWGGGKQRIIAQGEPVDEGQKLMTIPDLSQMVVNAKVHEAMAPRVRGDAKRETGFSTVAEFGLYLQPNPLTPIATIAAYRTDLKTPFLLEHRKLEQELIGRGQEATIRVTAFPDRQLKGHVTSIAEVASQDDLFASDVKVYQTYVAVDESFRGLKPGMDAEVTIEVDSSPEPVLAVPLQGVLGGVEQGAKRKCFVMTPDGPEQREITLGKSNEKMAEVKDGLEEGEKVILNPLVLLSEKERMAPENQPVQVGGKQGRGGPGRGGKKQGGPDGAAPGGGMQGGPRQGGGMQGGPPQGGGMQGGGMQGGGRRGGMQGGGAGGGAGGGGAKGGG